MIEHPFPPLYDGDSHILILGSFPSVKSREQLFFYGHPQNRFWKVIAGVVRAAEQEDLQLSALGICPDDYVPRTIEEKKTFLHEHHIALWDVIGSCSIEGSSDSSIRDVCPNDLTEIFGAADIRGVFCNGGKSFQMYQKYQLPVTGREAVRLPSTSPANAAWSAQRLTEEWGKIILPALKE